MLKKCLKYDLSAVFRLLWILLVAIGIVIVAGGVGLRLTTELFYLPDYMTEASTDADAILVMIQTLVGMGGYLFFILCMMALGAILTIGSVLVYWRLYSHFFTDQGYLTFTLPVKRSTLYLSKVLTCTIVETAMLLVALVCGMLVIPFVIPTEGFALLDINFFIKVLPSLLKEAWETSGIAPMLWSCVYLSLMPPAFLAAQLASSGLIFLCITLGSTIFKKGKLLASIGVYLLVNAVTYVVSQAISIPLTFSISGLSIVLTTASPHVGGIVITLFILISVAISACLAAIFHFFNLTLLERKLNLA